MSEPEPAPETKKDEVSTAMTGAWFWKVMSYFVCRSSSRGDAVLIIGFGHGPWFHLWAHELALFVFVTEVLASHHTYAIPRVQLATGSFSWPLASFSHPRLLVTTLTPDLRFSPISRRLQRRSVHPPTFWRPSWAVLSTSGWTLARITGACLPAWMGIWISPWSRRKSTSTVSSRPSMGIALFGGTTCFTFRRRSGNKLIWWPKGLSARPS